MRKRSRDDDDNEDDDANRSQTIASQCDRMSTHAIR